MPFTASHIAAVLPFARTKLLSSALVVGSMAPDLPMFVPGLSYGNSHSTVGVFTVDAALGVALLLVWHLVLADALRSTAPSGLRRRLPRAQAESVRRALSWRSVVMTYVSLVVGSSTHVIWDAFTHPNRWGSRHIEWLAARHGALPGTGWAQYGSSLLGAAIVTIWLALWWRRTPARAQVRPVAGRPALAPAVWLVPLLAGGITAATALAPMVTADPADPKRVAVLALTSAISTAAAVLLTLAVVWRLVHAFSTGRPNRLRWLAPE